MTEFYVGFDGADGTDATATVELYPDGTVRLHRCDDAGTCWCSGTHRAVYPGRAARVRSGYVAALSVLTLAVLAAWLLVTRGAVR